MRARHPLDMPEGTDMELEEQGQLQLCHFTARWDPWFALFWWWAIVTGPLTWAIARQGVKRGRLAERRYLGARTAFEQYFAYAEGMASMRAAQRFAEFIQALPVRLEQRFSR